MTRLKIAADSNADSDSFGRAPAAKSLLDTLMAVDHSQGAVVALQGAWGSGKSWLLHAAERELDSLADATKPLWIQFSPWALSGSDALVEALIKEIAGQIKLGESTSERATKLTELGDRLLEYAENLSVIRHLAAPAAFINPALGAAVAVVGHGAQYVSGAAKDARPLFKRLATAIKGLYPPPPAGRPALMELRERVIDALDALARPVVVVLDDLDRMSPKEVADIVQTVKAVANFPRVVYVLAFDPQVIAESLERSLSLPVGGGRRYLEKIVQITIDVPQPPRFLLRDATQQALDDALAFAKWSLIADFTNDLVDSKAVLHASALLETPRDVNRLRVRLQVAFPALKDEICPSDLLLIEALRFKAPSVIDWIEAHHADVLRSEGVELEPDYLARGSIRGADYRAPLDGDESSTWRQDLRVHLEQALGTVSSAAVDSVLRILFDTYGSAKQKRGAVRPFRVQALRNWTRWLAQVAHDKILDNSRIVEWLEASAEIKPELLWPTPIDFIEVEQRLRVFVSSVSGDRLQRAASLYIAAIQHFGIPTLRRAAGRNFLKGTSLLDPVFSRSTELYSDDGGDFSRHTFEAIFQRALEAGHCMPALVALETAPQLQKDTEAQTARRSAWKAAAANAIANLDRLEQNGTDPVELAFYLAKLTGPRASAEEWLRPLFTTDLDRALKVCFQSRSNISLAGLFNSDGSPPSSSRSENPDLVPARLSPDFVLEFFQKEPALKLRYPALFDTLTKAGDSRSSPQIDF